MDETMPAEKAAVNHGVVKWFRDEKGYGFIRAEGTPDDIMVHWVDIKMEGFKTLAPGDHVEFRIQRTEKGLKALDVVLTEKVQQPGSAAS